MKFGGARSPGSWYRICIASTSTRAILTLRRENRSTAATLNTCAEMTYPRDLIGYGRNGFDPEWPGGARLALQIVLNYEEGSEYSVPDGDGFSEVQLAESAPSVPQGTRDLATEST